MSYDTWKMQTPEEYMKAVWVECEDCGDGFETYDFDRKSCPDCWEEEKGEFLEYINEPLKKCSAEIVEEIGKRRNK